MLKTVVRVSILPVFVLMLCGGAAQAEGLPANLWHKDVPQAWQTAKRLGRPMVIFVSMEHCPHCHRMMGQTLNNRSVQAALAESFVPLYVKLEDHRGLVKQLGVKTFPSTVVVAPDTTVLEELTGFRTPEQLKKSLSQANSAHGTAQAEAGTGWPATVTRK